MEPLFSTKETACSLAFAGKLPELEAVVAAEPSLLNMRDEV